MRLLNIAIDDKAQPSLVNLDHVLRIKPGSCSSGNTGRDAQCCFIMRAGADTEYDGGVIMSEPYQFDVHLPMREIIRRITKETLVI